MAIGQVLLFVTKVLNGGGGGGGGEWNWYTASSEPSDINAISCYICKMAANSFLLQFLGQYFMIIKF